MRKALFIGINDYTNVQKLSGCTNDAIAMASVLERHSTGQPNFSSKIITSSDEMVTKKLLNKSIHELFSGSCEIALLYFAGHGAFNESIEEGVLIPQDYEDSNDGIRISDILLQAINAKEIHSKVIILDCCHAGSAGEQRALKGGNSVISEGITILTACKKEETAKADTTKGHGVFTDLLLQALHGGAANILGNITPGSLYSFVDSALGPWDQRPVFKTNVSRFVSLREMPPRVPLEILRQLPEWFPEPESIYPLNPSYEDTTPEYNPENSRTLKKLQLCNRNGLIDPYLEEHMYYAAMNSSGCKLTALGAYYRDLAIKKHI